MKDRKFEELYDKKKLPEDQKMVTELEREKTSESAINYILNEAKRESVKFMRTKHLISLENDLNITGLVYVAMEKLNSRKLSREVKEREEDVFIRGTGKVGVCETANILFKITRGENDWFPYFNGHFKEHFWWGINLEAGDKDANKMVIRVGNGHDIIPANDQVSFNTKIANANLSGGFYAGMHDEIKFNYQNFNKDGLLDNLRDSASDTLLSAPPLDVLRRAWFNRQLGF